MKHLVLDWDEAVMVMGSAIGRGESIRRVPGEVSWTQTSVVWI